MLTDTAIRNAKAAGKNLKLADEKGLFLLVTPSGGKWWRLNYRFEGKQKTLSLGIYPEVGLKDARDRAPAPICIAAKFMTPIRFNVPGGQRCRKDCIIVSVRIQSE